MLFIYSYNSTKLSLKHITLINIALHNCHASINSYGLHQQKQIIRFLFANTFMFLFYYILN